MIAYRIRDWDKHFECNRTRRLKRMFWVPFPNSHDSEGYTELLDHRQGAAHLGAWLACVQVASRCAPRGTLVRHDGRPLSVRSLSRMTRIPEEILTPALERLVSIGWIESYEIAHPGAEIRHEGVPTWNGMEVSKTPPESPLQTEKIPTESVRYADLADRLMRIWNEEHGPLPAIRTHAGTRRKRMAALVKDCDEDETLVRAAVQAFAADEFIARDGRYGIDTLVRPMHRQKWVERGRDWLAGKRAGRHLTAEEIFRETR